MYRATPISRNYVKYQQTLTKRHYHTIPVSCIFLLHTQAALARCSTFIDLYRSSFPLQHFPKTVMKTHTSIHLFLPSNHIPFLTRSIHLPSYCLFSTSLFRSTLRDRYHPSISFAFSQLLYALLLLLPPFLHFFVLYTRFLRLSFWQVLY